MGRLLRNSQWVLLVFCLLLGSETAFSETPEIRGGWSPGLPYQFESISPDGEAKLTGLDIEIMKELSRKADFHPVFVETSWEENLREVQSGELDFALAATPVASRQEWAFFSVPYRKENIAMFVRRGEMGGLPGENSIETLKQFLSEGKRIGVIRGYYNGPEFVALTAQEKYAAQILPLNDELSLMEALLTESVDAILADRLAAASAAAQAEALLSIEMVPVILYQTPPCLMFSKATTPPSTVEAFDAAIKEMQDSGRLAVITRHYLVPQLLLITMKTPWFVLFDIIGTISFAISGVLIARRERYDIIGACVLAALPAVGGGILRDIITTRTPIGIVQTPMLLYLVLGTVLTGTLFYFLHDWLFPKNANPSSDPETFRWNSSLGALEIFDAIGLSTFTIIGVMVAVEQRCEPLWLWGPVLGGLTAAGGSVLRDVLRSQSDIPTLKGSIYPEIAVFWAWIFSLVIIFRAQDLTLQEVLLLTLSVMAAIFVTRILVLHFGLRSIFLGRRSKVFGLK
jgi:polar amino acid transport system substrate-binding protein